MKARNDETGWKRGAGAYSRDYAKFDRPVDRTSVGSEAKDIRGDEFTGEVSRGGPPRYAPKSGPVTNGGMREYPLTGKGKDPAKIKDNGYGQKRTPR